MQPLQPNFIGAYDKGLTKDRKPFLVPEQAFSDLQNAYVYRQRVKKRECLELVGRLRRELTAVLLSTTVSSPGAGNVTFNLFTGLIPTFVTAAEINAELVPGSISSPLVITLGAPFNETLTDNTGTGILVAVPGTNISSGFINYGTGDVTIIATGAVGASSITLTSFYYPGLPVMGIQNRELSVINQEESVFFDQVYAYKFTGGAFQEYITGTTWQGSDSEFFSSANYQGATPGSRAFFVTNFNNSSTIGLADPIRYTLNGTSWNDFAPLVANVPESAASVTLYQARILIPYYGRLLALNVWEGETANGQENATNIFNRCRFSQIGNPLEGTVPGTIDLAWRSDLFGRGGFIDAPTNEAIVSAIFYKNTLIVGFERSTWQLRYVGEYGLPFIWERISSDFGTESTFSNILFDDGVFSIGDKAIVVSNGVNVKRLDIDIPDTVFVFKNANEGTARIQGVRDFKRELVFWSYVDSTSIQPDQVYPNRVLVYNYRNQTWAVFRDSTTAFGSLQTVTGISWDSLDVFWDDESTTWDDPDEQSAFPFIVIGNQQGFVHKYGYKTPDDASLSITGVDLTTSPITLTIPNHNLEEGEIVYLTNLQFLDATGTSILSTDLNEKTYQVTLMGIDQIGILKWVEAQQQYVNNFTFTPVTTAIYVGGGKAALDPVLYIATKDFNPYQTKGMQMKMSYIDFLMDATEQGAMSVELWLNSSLSVKGNLLIGNKECSTDIPAPYYVPNSQYAWQRFYATLAGQYVRVIITYDNTLMNTLDTRTQSLEMNAMNIFTRSGGKIPY